jgi:threonine dehydrogenase-like Zn-dependent dehydrogenase
MTTETTAVFVRREPELLGQTVVVIGGSAGIGLATARRARVEGASVILTGRNPDRLQQAAVELNAQRAAAFDAIDPIALQTFFQDLPTPIEHVMITAGAPRYGLAAKCRRRRLDADSPSACCSPSRSHAALPTGSGRSAPCCLWAARTDAAQERASQSSRPSLSSCTPSLPASHLSSRPSASI